ncbi:Uma2 family endonuclease [Streptomyces sp. NPDC048156]|uniref:Uma2 family endonuclease n=1 Tax=Streptomyces sp. NPDC048156 TaxID=3365502 RepID=UPI003718BA76
MTAALVEHDTAPDRLSWDLLLHAWRELDTSRSNAKDDRTKKLWAYAHAPVPVYLLVDRFDEYGPTATLFTGPQNGAYKHAERVPFGECLELPDPFAATVDTAGFPG